MIDELPYCEELLGWTESTMRLCRQPAKYKSCSVIGGIVCEDHRCKHHGVEYSQIEIKEFLKEQKKALKIKPEEVSFEEEV